MILSGDSGYYELTLRPLRRGNYCGVIAFVAQEPEMYVELFESCLNNLIMECARPLLVTRVLTFR